MPRSKRILFAPRVVLTTESILPQRLALHAARWALAGVKNHGAQNPAQEKLIEAGVATTNASNLIKISKLSTPT